MSDYAILDPRGGWQMELESELYFGSCFFALSGAWNMEWYAVAGWPGFTQMPSFARFREFHGPAEILIRLSERPSGEFPHPNA